MLGRKRADVTFDFQIIGPVVINGVSQVLIGNQRSRERIREIQCFIVIGTTNEKADDRRNDEHFQRVNDENRLAEGEHHRHQPFIRSFRAPFQ